MIRTLLFSTLPLVASSSLVAQGDPAKPTFAPLVELKAGGESITEMMYPSPVLHDIDRDGIRELVIGDIFGHIRVGEPADTATTWSKLTKVHANDEILRLNNW